MLETQVLNADSPSEGGSVLILMHGRGADPGDLAPVRRWLPSDLTVVLPRAPYHGAQWGYGPGWAWYRYEGADRPEPESFRGAQDELDALLDGLTEVVGLEPGAVFVGGFSQGGTMSIARALRRPGTLTGVINFSGFLADHPDVPVTEASAAGTPIFWGHGTGDSAIPFSLAESGRERLREAGAELETRDYSMGHGIIREEVADAVAWLERVRGGGRAPLRADGG